MQQEQTTSGFNLGFNKINPYISTKKTVETANRPGQGIDGLLYTVRSLTGLYWNIGTRAFRTLLPLTNYFESRSS